MADPGSVVRAVPDLCLLLAPDLTIVEASDAYLEATMIARDDLVGRGVCDIYPTESDDEVGDGPANLRVSLDCVLHDRRATETPIVRAPVRTDPQGTRPEPRFWKLRNHPVLDDDGGVRMILHRADDATEIIHLRRAQRALTRQLERAEATATRHRELLERAPDAMVIVGQDCRIRMANLQAEAMFGYPRDELIGQPLEMLIPERFRNHHSGHIARFFGNPVSRPMGSGLELYGRRKDGSEVPIEVSLSPQREGDVVTVSSSIRDISRRKRYEIEARVASDRLRSAVDTIQDAFALFDAEDRLVMCNSVFRRFVHAADPASLVGKPYPEILDAWLDDFDFPDDGARKRFREARVARRFDEPAPTFDVRLRDGRTLRIMDRRTAEGGIVETIWDLTEDEHRAAELREARRTAETASAAKSEFLSSMSHELRTPLNAVLGFAQLLLRDRRAPLEDRHRERVEHILGSGEHLLRLIDDVLNLAKIEAGRVTMSFEPVAVADVIDEIRRTLEPIASRQGVALEVAPLPANLPLVLADRTRYLQILMNFGSNAIKYNHPAGRLRIAVSTPSGEAVRVAVADTGIGIPLEKQAKLFQPFQRAGQETGPIEGTGIGLVITKRLAELMKGSVGFRSEQQQGSEFWIDLPALQHEELASPPTPDSPRAARAASTGARHLVLCVEDNPANIIFMRDLMSTLDDIELVTVPTAELGVALARARHPELVLMDINLPGMSGLDALRTLRLYEDTREIPVIALTAAASERDRQHGLEAGFYRYLSKPVDLDQLFEAIDAALRP